MVVTIYTKKRSLSVKRNIIFVTVDLKQLFVSNFSYAFLLHMMIG